MLYKKGIIHNNSINSISCCVFNLKISYYINFYIKNRINNSKRHIITLNLKTVIPKIFSHDKIYIVKFVASSYLLYFLINFKFFFLFLKFNDL